MSNYCPDISKNSSPQLFFKLFFGTREFFGTIFPWGEVVGMDIEMIQVHYIYYAAADLTRGLA